MYFMLFIALNICESSLILLSKIKTRKNLITIRIFMIVSKTEFLLKVTSKKMK